MDGPSRTRSETDVLVVGAGPTGLTMTSELVARSIGGRIIDKTPLRSEPSRGLVVQARSLELLQKTGIAAELVARGRQTIKATPLVEGRLAAEVEFGDIGVDDTPYPYLLFVSQLGIKYPDSPIVGEELDGADGTFHCGSVGHRVPDGPLRLDGNGRPGSLFSCLWGTPHHLLLFGGWDSDVEDWVASDAELRALLVEYEVLIEPHLIVAGESTRMGAEIQVYVDEPGLVHERYGLKGAGYYLIRPDGYVAFRAPGTDLRLVRAYLQRTFVSPTSIKAQHR